MASTDAGGNSPPDPGNGNSNNGNISPTGLNALLESISDINLGLLAVSNRFLSAKNSVELHRNRARNRFFPYRSLPTVLGSEQPHHVPESESGPSARGASSSENVSQTSVRAHHGRNVNWADLHSSCGKQMLVNRKPRSFGANSSIILSSSSTISEVPEISSDRSTPDFQNEPANDSVPKKVTDSLNPMNYSNSSEMETSEVDFLHPPNQTHPFSSEKSFFEIDTHENPFMDAVSGFKRLLLEEDGTKNETPDVANQTSTTEASPNFTLPKDLIPRSVLGIGQTPSNGSKTEFLDNDFVSSQHINTDDGLIYGVEERMDGPKKSPPESMYFSPQVEGDLMKPITRGTYLGYPLNDMAQQLNETNPVTVFYEESLVIPPNLNQTIGDHLEDQVPLPLPAVEENKRVASYYDTADSMDFQQGWKSMKHAIVTRLGLLKGGSGDGNRGTASSQSPLLEQASERNHCGFRNRRVHPPPDDDDDVDVNSKPDLRTLMKTADELPVPDPLYVAATVPENLHPLITKTYKKDCRTWLWKSKAQRERRLKEDAEDEANGHGSLSTPSPTNTSENETPGRTLSSSEEGRLTKKIGEMNFSNHYS